jgi:hypothetical protein
MHPQAVTTSRRIAGRARRPALVAAAVIACVIPRAAAAGDGYRYLELAIPDVRYEIDDALGGGRFSLSFPLAVAPWTFGFGARPEQIPGGMPGSTLTVGRPVVVVVPELFAEPQLQLNDVELRGVLGARAYLIHGSSGFDVAIEGLGVAGEDGTGGGVGIGVGYGSVVSVGYRRIWTDASARHALLFDVRLFVWPSDQPQATLQKLGRYRGPLPP